MFKNTKNLKMLNARRALENVSTLKCLLYILFLRKSFSFEEASIFLITQVINTSF